MMVVSKRGLLFGPEVSYLGFEKAFRWFGDVQSGKPKARGFDTCLT